MITTSQFHEKYAVKMDLPKNRFFLCFLHFFFAEIELIEALRSGIVSPWSPKLFETLRQGGYGGLGGHTKAPQLMHRWLYFVLKAFPHCLVNFACQFTNTLNSSNRDCQNESCPLYQWFSRKKKKYTKYCRVQAIIILIDHQHVDIMFVFPNNDDNDKTEVFIKGTKVLFH